ncbi:CLUMA_CG009512, isoform A [Clunio marinus]|uniref:CLUMA_CG009512, isoform A n=1 Tax=Clunio marinus TaxID=568069 RepID=A0A1J1I941_9DIPT|nr:CLUMA_CG009512, isoform A [Clunio marinus]
MTPLPSTLQNLISIVMLDVCKSQIHMKITLQHEQFILNGEGKKLLKHSSIISTLHQTLPLMN